MFKKIIFALIIFVAILFLLFHNSHTDTFDNSHTDTFDNSHTDTFDNDIFLEIPGCTDESAINYNSKATIDNGSCKYFQESSNKFKVVVLVDTTSEIVTYEQAQTIINESNQILLNLTGFEFELIDFVEDDTGLNMSEIVENYLSTINVVPLNGIIIFSYGDNNLAQQAGGYSFSIQGGENFSNNFVSPRIGNEYIYVDVQHFSHRYAECGYNNTDVIMENISMNGECRNSSGTSCVQHNGYSMCQTAINDLYASTPTYLVSSIVIHEFMHSFGLEGVGDHYGTPECSSEIGLQDNFNLEESQQYNGMCPFIYQNFINSYSF